MQLMTLSKAAVEAALQSRPQQYEALQLKAKVLYQAHLVRGLGVPQADQVNDASIAALQTSLSMSRDIQGIIASASNAAEEISSDRIENRAQMDSLLEKGTLSTTALPVAPARPTHDRPKTFD